MPVKGALLQHWLYDDPSERLLSDVDLLVRPEDFGRAIERLESEGYRRAAGSGVGAIVMQTPLALRWIFIHGFSTAPDTGCRRMSCLRGAPRTATSSAPP